MSANDFTIDMPEKLDDILNMLAERKGRAILIAGATDILIDIKNGTLNPNRLVSLSQVKELKSINESNGCLLIGATVTANRLAKSGIIRTRLPALSDAAFSMASYQIRNAATLGGNLCSAVPSADLAPSLIAAEANVILRSKKTERRVPLESFFTGPRKTVLNADEVLTHVEIPKQPANSATSYKKFRLREANALAVASVAARLVIKNGKIHGARLVLGAVAPTPMLSIDAMRVLVGKPPSRDAFVEAAEIAYTECSPISDVRCCADFRRQLIRTLTIRALDEALGRAGGT
jgi:carbon-monoxide dehydrogenase medium subunit